MENNLALWTDENKISQIKEIYGKGLTNQEFETFLQIGKVTGLNPFMREIWAVKYGTSPANIFIGRDGYRKSAQANLEYDFHIVDAVYENDIFKITNGEVEHSYDLKNRGKLIGAYCVVKRKSSSKAIFNFVDFIEYYQGNRKIVDGKITNEILKNSYGKDRGETLWDTKPATMIKKVAEAQTLRQCFQEMFAGTYDEDEKFEENKTLEITAEEQEENYNRYLDLMKKCKNEDDLKNIFIEFNKARKDKPKLVNAEQVQKLVELKDVVKNTFGKNDETVEAEIVEETKQ